jgi:hypothetical protein
MGRLRTTASVGSTEDYLSGLPSTTVVLERLTKSKGRDGPSMSDLLQT